jgi:hypothetical protein
MPEARGRIRAAAARWTVRRIAGFAYLAPIGTVAGIWYTLLFVASGPQADRLGLLREWLLEDPQRAVFWWLAALPVASLALALAYLAPGARGKLAAIVLCGFGAALAAGAWRSLDASIAAVVTLPLAFSVPDAIWQLARRPSAPA